VNWDQRGAGKTFGKSGPLDASVTVDRMAQDGVEVAEFIRTRLHKPKIVLVGLSWGTALGVRMARARPDLFYAYVGTGQSVNQGKYKAIGYSQLIVEARARHDSKAITELEANGPPPYGSCASSCSGSDPSLFNRHRRRTVCRYMHHAGFGGHGVGLDARSRLHVPNPW
jgi:pimeloyl-ACP methyl ester carboxylesterase